MAQASLLLFATLAISLSWLITVDAWPASDRPYVDGSTNDTELNLALGYNGFARIDGQEQNNLTDAQTQLPFPLSDFFAGRPAAAYIQPGSGAQPQLTTESFHAAGGVVAGAAGPLRLLDTANGGQIGWVLPFAVFGGIAALWAWRRDRSRRAVVAAFLGWLFLYGAMFSFARGTYHAYYTAALAPAVAALCGAGAQTLVSRSLLSRRWLIAALAVIELTVVGQLHIESLTPGFLAWVRLPMIVAALAAAGLLTAASLRRSPAVTAGASVCLLLTAILLIPGFWSVSEAGRSPFNATLPQAGPHEGAAAKTFGSPSFDDGQSQLAAWIDAHTSPGSRWRIAVPNSQSAATLIAEDDVSALPIGGFTGSADSITVRGFADLVRSGQIRFVEGNRIITGVRSDSSQLTESRRIEIAVAIACGYVEDSSIPQGYVIFDCAGKGDQLQAVGLAEQDLPPA